MEQRCELNRANAIGDLCGHSAMAGHAYNISDVGVCHMTRVRFSIASRIR